LLNPARGLARAAIDVFRRLPDLLDARRLLARRRGDLHRGRGRRRDRFAEVPDRVAGGVGDLHAALRAPAALFDHVHGLAAGELDVLQNGAHLRGRFLGALGQAAHLARDHGEAASLFACARRFDARVQRQHVRLLGEIVDHVDDGVDLFGALNEAGDGLRDGGHLIADVHHSVDAVFDRLRAAGGRLLRPSRELDHRLRFGRRLIESLAQLGDGRAHLAHARGLLGGVGGLPRRGLEHLRRSFRQRLRRAHQLFDDLRGAPGHRAERVRQPAEIVVDGIVDARAQIALGHVLREHHHLEKPTGDPAKVEEDEQREHDQRGDADRRQRLDTRPLVRTPRVESQHDVAEDVPVRFGVGRREVEPGQLFRTHDRLREAAQLVGRRVCGELLFEQACELRWP
jgi:hypothetical protein